MTLAPLTCLVLFSAAPSGDRIDRLLADIRATGFKRVVVLAEPDFFAEDEVDDQQPLTSDGVRVDIGTVWPEETWFDFHNTPADAVMPLGDAAYVHTLINALGSAGLGLPVLLVQPDSQGRMALAATRILPVLREVFGSERRDDHDVAWLKTGEGIAGQLTGPSLSIATPYAAPFTIETAKIAGIACEADGRHVIVTVNGNRLVGALVQHDFALATADGGTRTLALDQVAKIVRRVQPNENQDLPRNDVIVLTRGDVLTGKLPTCTVTIQRDPDEHALEPAVIRVADGCVVARHKQSIVKDWADYRWGTLDQDEFEIALDLGPTVKLARTQLDLLLLQRGYAETIGAASELSFTPPGWRAREWQRSDTSVVDGALIELIRVAPGSFAMGWPYDSDNQKPVHTVKLTHAYYLGATEVTQAQWRAVMGAIPSVQQGDDLPVTDVTWQECTEFCRRLTEHERQAGRIAADVSYHLPTEAEWEYACRAGSGGLIAGKLDAMGWFAYNSRIGKYDENHPQAHRVALKQPNAWGFYDMYGNVYEYCADEISEYTSEAQVDPHSTPGKANEEVTLIMRGGSWACAPVCCTSAARHGCGIDVRQHWMGFRVARTIP